MGFFDRLWESATGQGAKKTAANAQKAAKKTAATVAQQGLEQGQRYDTGAAQSMGANAAEYMQKANEAAQAQAAQAGQAAATQGSRAALQAARTAGVNPGQAALAGSQQAGDIYGRTFQQGLESGRQQYGQATQQFAGQGAEMANRALGGAGLQAGVGTQMYGQAAQKGQALGKGIAGALGGVASLFSDEELKEDIRPASDLDATVKALRPVRFRYKPEVPAPEGEQLGVVAQDVEKSPLAGAVVETPEGKALDTAQLTGSNTALIVELGARIRDLEKELAEATRGKE